MKIKKILNTCERNFLKHKENIFALTIMIKSTYQNIFFEKQNKITKIVFKVQVFQKDKLRKANISLNKGNNNGNACKNEIRFLLEVNYKEVI